MMNKDLERFSEERLKEIAAGGFKSLPNFNEAMALARIALAAKQAKPVAWVTWHQGFRAPDDCEDYLNAYTYKTDEKSVDGTDAFPVYTTPPANSPEIPDGWISCSERMPENNPGKWSIPVAVLTDTGDVFKLSCMGGYWQRTQAFIDSGGRITHWMSLPC